MSEDIHGVPASPSGSQASPGAADASPPSVSIPNAEIVLHYPKHLENLGMVARIATCLDAGPVWFTGERINFDVDRLPRELRMREYVATRPKRLYNLRRVLESASNPIAVELIPGAESLPDFEHPANALYVFGPEDGSLPPEILRLCHRFVRIPTDPCLSLPMAVTAVLYDRKAKSAVAKSCAQGDAS